MPHLLRPVRRRTLHSEPTSGPLPPAVEARVRLSSDLLASVLEVEQRSRATLDDLEWADAVAARLVRRQQARRSIVRHGPGPSGGDGAS